MATPVWDSYATQVGSSVFRRRSCGHRRMSTSCAMPESRLNNKPSVIRRRRTEQPDLS